MTARSAAGTSTPSSRTCGAVTARSSPAGEAGQDGATLVGIELGVDGGGGQAVEAQAGGGVLGGGDALGEDDGALGPFEGRYQGVEGSGLGGGVGEQPATLLEGGQVAAGGDRRRAVVAAGEAGDGGEEGTGWLRREVDRGDQLSACRREDAGEVVVLGALAVRQLDAAQRDDEGGDDAVADGALVADPVAGPAEVRIEPGEVGVVGAGVRGGETEPSGERGVRGRRGWRRSRSGGTRRRRAAHRGGAAAGRRRGPS